MRYVGRFIAGCERVSHGETWFSLEPEIKGAFGVLATNFFGKFSVTNAQRHVCGEKTQLSSGWTLIGSELSSPNYNSSLEPNDRSLFVIST